MGSDSKDFKWSTKSPMATVFRLIAALRDDQCRSRRRRKSTLNRANVTLVTPGEIPYPEPGRHPTAKGVTHGSHGGRRPARHRQAEAGSPGIPRAPLDGD